MLRPVLIATAVLLGAGLLLLSALDAEARASLLAGLTDPILGLDHFLALLAIGIWAGRLRSSETWMLPGAFLAGLMAGIVLMVSQPPILLTDLLVRVVILGSILSFVAAFLIPIRVPRAEAVTTVAMIGSCHGYVHADEMGLTTDGSWFGVGVLLMASALAAAGVAVGLIAPRAA